MTSARIVVVSTIAVACVAVGSPLVYAVDQARDARVTTAPDTAVVQGIVVNDDEKQQPLRNVTVTLSRSGVEDLRTTATDEAGRYRFEGLAAGRYALSFGKGAYISMDYGAPRAGLTGQSITLVEGQIFAARPVAMLHGSAIAGRVLDTNGNPLSGAQVSASQVITVGGERRARVTPGASQSVTTNAHGEYRIFGLLPGAYLVAAQYERTIPPAVTTVELDWARQRSGAPAPQSARGSAFAPTLYPGTADHNAAVPVTVAKAEEQTGIDFSLRLVPVADIRGVVIGPDGQPVAGVSVREAPTRPPAFVGYGIRGARTLADGSFSFSALPPGDYTLTVRGGPVARPPVASPVSPQAITQAPIVQPPWWGRLDVTVSGADLERLTISMKLGFEVSGRVVVEGTGTPPWQLSALRFSLSDGTSSTLSSFAGSVSADGSFSVGGLAPGLYRFNMTLPSTPDEPWALKSARLGDRDLLDNAVQLDGNTPDLVVTVSNAMARLSGRLATAAGAPASRLYVMVFSTSPSDWRPRSRRIRDVQTTDAGAFAIDGLPAGEYYVCALTELDSQLRFEAEYLEQLIPASIKVRLADGERKVQDLRIGGS